MALDFASIASKKTAEVERPPLVPAGTMRFAVTKLPVQDKIESANGEWDTLTFFIQGKEYMEDVDPDLAEQYGPATNVLLNIRFMFDKNDETKFKQTEFRLKTFLESHLGVSDGSITIAEALNASVGAEFLGVVTHQQDKNDKELFHANVNKTAPVA